MKEIDKDLIIRKLLVGKLDITKYKILKLISEEINTYEALVERLGESKPLISFHLNGTAKKRENGLIGLGLVKKISFGDKLNNYFYVITVEGKYVLDILSNY